MYRCIEGTIKPGGYDITAIVKAAIRAPVEAMVTASAAHTVVMITAPLPGSISLLKLQHLCFICAVATNEEIPDICTEV